MPMNKFLNDIRGVENPISGNRKIRNTIFNGVKNSNPPSILERIVKDNDMTSFRGVVNIAVSHVFYSWVFGFGGKVKIKGPENVKEEYSEMRRAAVAGLE